MRTKVENFKRQELFDKFDSYTNPFSIITTKIEITNIYKLCKTKKNIYATIGYYLTKAMNKVDEFKYIKINNDIYKYDILNPSFTEVTDEGNVGFFTCIFDPDYQQFINNYNVAKKKFIEKKPVEITEEDGEVWLSCLPWFNFSGVIPPFNKDMMVPQLIWDKFVFEGDLVYINLMIMAHHGFVDGFHISKLIELINAEISEISP